MRVKALGSRRYECRIMLGSNVLTAGIRYTSRPRSRCMMHRTAVSIPVSSTLERNGREKKLPRILAIQTPGIKGFMTQHLQWEF